MACGACEQRKRAAIAARSKNAAYKSNSGCMKKYDEVSLLDRRAIALHKKFRFSQAGYRFAEMQKVTRGWLLNMKNECPDEDQLSSFAEYINGEYAKYFGGQSV